MYVRDEGRPDGRPILLLHGGGVGGWMWNPAIEHLPSGFRFIVPDLPGHDRSHQEPYASHAQTVAGVIEIIEERAAGPVIVVGFSLGAQLAVILAANRPDLVERVVTVSAQAKPLRGPGPLLALLRMTAPLAKREWFARLQARELFIPAPLLGDYLRTSAHISAETLVATVGENIRFTPPSGWARFARPALILVGEKERNLMKESARVLQRALPGSEREVVADCGHGIPLQQPAWFARRLLEWI